MGRKFHDLTGQRFERLVVLSRTSNQGHNLMWECLCDCGEIKAIQGNELKKGSTKSCGCLRQEQLKTHGESKTRLYRIWSLMLGRCNNSKSDAYKWYGERGIRVCEEWNTYVHFAEWARKNGYSEDFEIDRIDVDGDYTAENCRWVTLDVQAYNKRQYENNTSGTTGVSFTRGKWCARISVKGERILLGNFLDIEDAIQARKEAEIKYYGELKHE